MEINRRSKAEAIREMQTFSLREKIRLTESFIKRLLFEHSRPAIDGAGRRDSTVLLFLALKQELNVDIVWVDTGVEFPDCVRFIRHLKEKWQLNLHIVNPEGTF